MRIAINIRSLAKDEWGSLENYMHGLLQQIMQQHTEHEFLFISDRPLTNFFLEGLNAKVAIVGPLIKGNVSLKYWYDVKLTSAVKKFNADILVSFDGICSLATKIPQVLIIKDLAFINHPKWFVKSNLLFYKLFQKKIIAKAKSIVVFNETVKQEIADQYKTPPEKIAVVLPAANEHFKLILFEERESIKDGYADGREYFLFVGGANPKSNLMNMLKAFSIFKKWQQSSMKLLVIGKTDALFLEKLKTYKYRDDVEMLGYLPQQQYAKLMAASYGLVYPVIYEGVGLPMIEAMQCGVPVIANNLSTLTEIAADAALYVNATDVDELANQMKLLYKDETLRSQLIQKGLVQVEKFSWKKSAPAFIKIIESAASK